MLTYIHSCLHACVITAVIVAIIVGGGGVLLHGNLHPQMAAIFMLHHRFLDCFVTQHCTSKFRVSTSADLILTTVRFFDQRAKSTGATG